MEHPLGGEFSTYNSTPEWKYDVFLSFAGKDTRLKFTDHLDEAFSRNGIKTFRDDVDLEKGGDIKQNLFEAIQDSLCAVLIISKNYANSTWCLDELQHILQCRNTLHRRVFPIFYDVDPADVRRQQNGFGKALAERKDKFIENTTKVQNWRNDLSEIANLSGWDTRGMHEADLIKNIVGAVWSYLCSKLPSYCDDNIVGIDSRVADMMPFLEIGLDDKRFVGIWGMGGVGKTTLARVVSEKISYKFEVCCFLANVRETLRKEGLVSLQKRLLSHLKIKGMEISDDYEGMKIMRKLLCNKKVLLVLDDLDNMSQLKNLAESPNWFGKGSRIIITTRDSQLLTSSGVDKQGIYEMKTMKEDESLQLFSNKAFYKDHPEDKYLELSQSVVKYAGGLPLALQALGSFLCGRSKAEWRDALDRLKKIPDKNILQVLKISYDGLNEDEKTIFLDIACFFKGWQKTKVVRILESCDLHTTIGIKVLIEKTLLVETKDRKLDMHDLFEDLGRHIIHQESPDDVGKRSRLWEFEDIKEVLEDNKGSKAIQAIVTQSRDPIEVHPEAFSKMSNIRLLYSSIPMIINDPLILPRRLKLKFVRWGSFPFELPLAWDKLVYIEMHGSRIKQFWNGIRFMTKLKFIHLADSYYLTETPDFSRAPNLECLCLFGCTSLVKVHPSLGKLKKLVDVDLSGCENLEFLPRKLETNSLMKLDLCGCEKVAELPEFGEGMQKLSYLNVGGTAITRLPESLGSLTGLQALYLYGLDLVNLPTGCFSSLFGLLFLSLSGCQRLKSLPRLPPRLIRLDATYCNSMEPLSDRELWTLVASLDHEYRGRTKYVIPDDDFPLLDEDFDISPEFKHVGPECLLPLRDFCAVIPGSEIPSWFPNKEYCTLDGKRGEYVIKVNIPRNFRDSEWFGIVVCFLFSGSGRLTISWSSKAPEDDDFICKDWAQFIGLMDNHLCIMVLELNEKTCWQHIRGHNNTLHIKLSTDSRRYWDGGKIEILGCGWRVLCKQEIKEWCNLNGFNQPQLPSLDEVKFARSVISDYIEKVEI